MTEEEVIREGNETVLIVDDDDDVRDSMRVYLRLYGYTVLEANEGTVVCVGRRQVTQ